MNTLVVCNFMLLCHLKGLKKDLIKSFQLKLRTWVFCTFQVHVEGHKETNPFTKKKRSTPLDQALLASVKSIPKLGEVKSRMLLEKFGSM